MLYLALDQSSRRIGWAIGAPDRKPVTGLLPIPSGGFDHALMCAGVRDWLKGLLLDQPITNVIFESPFMGKDAASFMKVCKLIAVVELTCLDFDVRCREVGAAQWRGRFIGFAQAPRSVKSYERRREILKNAALDACAALGWAVNNDDEAEACGILDYALACDFKDYGSRGGLFA